MRGNLQKIMIGLVVVIVLAFIFFSGDSLVKLVDTIKQGTPFFIIAAVVAQLCKYLAQGRGFQACFNTVNGHISYRTDLVKYSPPATMRLPMASICERSLMGLSGSSTSTSKSFFKHSATVMSATR
jgi:hypothetical protein